MGLFFSRTKEEAKQWGNDGFKAGEYEKRMDLLFKDIKSKKKKEGDLTNDENILMASMSLPFVAFRKCKELMK